MVEKTLDQRASDVSGYIGNQYSGTSWVPGGVYIVELPFGKVLVSVNSITSLPACRPGMATHKIGAASSQILIASLFFALPWHDPQFQAIMVPVSSPFIPPWEAEHHMPSLFKFLFVAGMAVGSVAGGLLFLSEYAEPGQKEVRSVVSGLKVRR